MQFIFERFVGTGNYHAVFAECRARNIKTRLWTAKRSGRTYGGKPISLGAIYKIISNPIYAGFMRCDGELFEGRHEPIIERSLWDRAQKVRQRFRSHHGRPLPPQGYTTRSCARGPPPRHISIVRATCSLSNLAARR